MRRDINGRARHHRTPFLRHQQQQRSCQNRHGLNCQDNNALRQFDTAPQGQSLTLRILQLKTLITELTTLASIVDLKSASLRITNSRLQAVQTNRSCCPQGTMLRAEPRATKLTEGRNNSWQQAQANCQSTLASATHSAPCYHCSKQSSCKLTYGA